MFLILTQKEQMRESHDYVRICQKCMSCVSMPVCEIELRWVSENNCDKCHSKTSWMLYKKMCVAENDVIKNGIKKKKRNQTMEEDDKNTLMNLNVNSNFSFNDFMSLKFEESDYKTFLKQHSLPLREDLFAYDSWCYLVKGTTPPVS